MRENILAILLLTTAACFAQKSDDTFWLGADTGWSTEMESSGHKFYNWKGEERECTAAMKDLGFNAIRIRVWVDPSKHGNWCDKADVLEKARRAKALGMEVMIDFHYSDWWADPNKQNIPAAWEKHNYKQMLKDLAAHTKDVLSLLKDNGITPRWVQVGNETSYGLLWSVEMDPATGWEKKDENGHTIITKTMGHWERNAKQYGGFIGAGYDAVKSIFPDAIVIIHLDNGFDNDLYNKNLDIVREGGGKWDMIGMSLYPYWSIESGKEPTAMRTIADCMKNIRLVSKKYGCDVMIVETGFLVEEERPWVMEQGREQFAELLRRAKTETNGRCKGVFYWEPECKPSVYKLGAYTDDGHPTAILRAIVDDNMRNGNATLAAYYDRRLVNIETTEGTITVELYNETPGHRDNFLRLAESHALDSVLFHRTIPGFMIQTGDPSSRYAPPTSLTAPATQLGDNDVKTATGESDIAAEIIYPQFFHKRGALSAARESDEDNPEKRSGASQFFIVWGEWPVVSGKKPYVPMLEYYETDKTMRKGKSYGKYWSKEAAPMPEAEPGTPWLDGGYSVFGQVVSGLDVVEKIQAVETDTYNRPLNDIRILRMTIVN